MPNFHDKTTCIFLDIIWAGKKVYTNKLDSADKHLYMDNSSKGTQSVIRP